MPTGPEGQHRPAYTIGNAVKVMRIATGEEQEKNKAAAEMGRKGAVASCGHDAEAAGGDRAEGAAKR